VVPSYLPVSQTGYAFAHRVSRAIPHLLRVRTRPFCSGLALLMLLSFAPQLAFGANRTWSGGGLNNNWSSGGVAGIGGNWSGAAAPAANDSLFFGGSTRLTNTNDLAADRSFAGITFNSGAGTFTLSGNRITLGGDVTNSSTNLQTINLAMILSADRTFTTSASGGDLTIGGVLSETGGARGIVKAGTGTLILSAVNTYTGGTTLSAGTLQLSGSGTLGGTSGALAVNGGTLDLNGTNQTVGALSGSSGTILNNNSTAKTLTVGTGDGTGSYGGVIADKTSGTGTLALTKTGAGTQTLTGNNTYTGTTTISAGTLSASSIVVSGGSSNLGNATSAVILGDASNQGTLSYTGAAATYTRGFTVNAGGGQLTNAGSGLLTVSTGGISTSGTFTAGAASGKDIAISSVISGGGGFTKTGADTVTLTGANTYNGATTVNNGTLTLDNNNSTTSGRLTNTSGITVNSGGTLLLAQSSGGSANTDRINDSATMTLGGGEFNTGGLSERGGTLAAPTAGIGALTLTATSTINFGSGDTSIIEFSGVGTHTAGTILQITNWDGIAGTGGGTERLLFAGTASSFTSLYNQSDVSFNGVTGYFTDQFSGFYEVTAVPEPSTWIGGALAVGVLGWSQLRKRSRAGRRRLKRSRK
jgi:autotransporter-associated beta strand protein